MRDASQPEPADVRLRLFGQLRLEVGDELIEVESSRGRALIGFLVVEGDGPHSRERAAFALWPDSTDAQAKTNLRKTLHGLRRNPHLEELIETTPRSLRWRRERTDHVDVDEFVSALGTARDAISADALRHAEQLYRGPLLVDCWDEWLVDHRQRLGELHVAALRQLAEALLADSQVDEAIRVGQAVVRCEPLQESSYRLLMSIYGAAGDRAAAARVYHQCVSTLRDELGVPPSIETTAAYDELTDSAPNAITEPRSTPTGTARSLLVGRRAEWETLTRLWPDADGDSARLVLVTGEPGIGKTHLVDAFAGWATRRGAAVAEARSFAAEGELGFGLMISWLRSPALVEPIRSLPEPDRAILARLLPELGDAPDDAALDHGEQRQRLFDVISRACRAAAGDRVLVLVADDAQWTDEQSLQAMQYVVRNDPDGRVLVLATVRREDLGPHAAIDRVAADLGAVGQSVEVPVERFERSATDELARQLVRSELSERAIDRLHAESEGNPLFIVEAVRAGWQETASELPISPRLRQVIDARVGQLSDDARELLAAAVTVGREFRVPVVQTASGLDDLAAVRALDELWRRGFIHEFSVDAYDFTHGKIRDAVYDGLSPAVRRRYHRRLAGALQDVDNGSIDAVSGRVAHHLDQGGDASEAVGWYLRGARQAQRLFAPEEAVRMLERALELARELPDDSRLARELEVLSALPTPLGAIEGFSSDRVVAVQERAVQVAGELGTDVQPTVLRSLVFLRLCQNRYEEAGELGEQLSTQAEREGDRGLHLEGVYMQGIAAFWRSAFDDARAHFERVVDEFTPDNRVEHLVRFGQDSQIICRSRLANTLRFLGDVDGAIATRDAAVEQATELGHPWTTSLTLIFASMLAVDLGERELLQDFAASMISLDIDARPNRLHTQAIVGVTLAQAGRAREGVERIRAAIDECGPINPAPGFRPTLWRLLVGAHEAGGGSEAGAVEDCELALRIDGTRIWWPDIERARQAFVATG